MIGNLILLDLAVLGLLIAFSALLNGAEAAYFSLGRARLKRMRAGPEANHAPIPLIDRPNELLVTLLVGITVINIGASALAALLSERVVGPRWAILVETVVMVLLLTTFAEVLPMTIAVKRPEQFLAVAGRPVAWLRALLTPVRPLLGALTTLVVRLIARAERRDGPELTEEELRTLVDVGTSEGVVERAEREMIHKVFEL